MEQNFNGIIVVVSNPVDILTQVVMKLSVSQKSGLWDPELFWIVHA